MKKTAYFCSIANEPLAGGGLGSHKNWLQGLDSPLIQDGGEDGGQKELKLRFDVSQYSPEEIVVKTVDNKLLVRQNNLICILPAILYLFVYFRCPQNTRKTPAVKRFSESITGSSCCPVERIRKQSVRPFQKMES